MPDAPAISRLLLPPQHRVLDQVGGSPHVRLLRIATQAQPTFAVPAADEHRLTLQTGPAHLLERQWAGQHQKAFIVPGRMNALTAGQACTIATAGAGHALHLLIGPRAQAELLQEAVGLDFSQLTLTNRFNHADPLFAQLAGALAAELRQPAPDPASRLYAQSLEQALLLHVVRRHSSAGRPPAEPTGALAPRHLRRVQEYVAQHLATGLDLAELAALTGYSPYHFARQFRQATGLAPYQYVLRQRMELARQLLARPGQPVRLVARQVGYASQSQFSRAFHRVVGVSPAAYAAALRR